MSPKLRSSGFLGEMTPQDGALVILLFIANFWQMSKLKQHEMVEIYKEHRKRLFASPSEEMSGWFFGIIWIIMYTLKLLSGYFFLYSGATIRNTPDYLAGLIALYVFSMYMDKQWSVWFFDQKRPDVALVICVFLVIASAIYLWLLSVYNGIEAAFWCYLPVCIWYGVACAWNTMWILGSDGPKKSDDPLDVGIPVPVNGKIPFRVPLKTPTTKGTKRVIDL